MGVTPRPETERAAVGTGPAPRGVVPEGYPVSPSARELPRGPEGAWGPGLGQPVRGARRPARQRAGEAVVPPGRRFVGWARLAYSR